MTPDDDAPTVAASRPRPFADASRDAPTLTASEAPSAGPSGVVSSRSGAVAAPGSSPSGASLSVGAPGPSGVAPTQGLSLASIVMHSEEAARARAFFRLCVGLAVLVSVFVTILAGPPVLRAVSYASCGAAFVASLLALRALRDESRYTARLVTVLGLLCGLCAEVLVLYFGLFTAATMVLPLGVYFFGLSESARAARAVFLFGAALFLAFAVGVSAGALPDLGPLPIRSLSPTWRWFFIVMIEAVFAMTFLLARSSRRATEVAIDRMHRANRQVVQRDALLAEARGELDRALRPGEGRHTAQVIGGYTLAEVLGRGGMGEVYRGENAVTGEVAAVKLLHPDILADPDHVRRFAREAELAGQVDSPYVARVLGSGLSPLPFVAMELLVGRDLAALLRKTPRLSVGQVAEVVDHAARALTALRKAGIVHRDLKPHNLFATEQGGHRVWKLLDFGVSKQETAGATLTRGALVGTPSYMAPEQAQMLSVDHRTDLYALTSVAYRALVGRAAFVGEDVAGVIYNVVHVPPPQPRAQARVPEDVELVLAIGMAKDPADRFATAEELAAAFGAAARGQLDATTRERGRRVLAKYPWSTARPTP